MSPDYLLIWEHRAEIVSGLYTSLLLIVFSGLSSIVLGIFIAPLLMSKNIVLNFDGGANIFGLAPGFPVGPP